ncbi:MAG: FtsX-like permease family protein [Dehalococcoidia bacterium]|nr:FtsX-like permease family protein [Dehalococcoidia bacterium]
MSPADALRIAVRAIMANRLRSMLTTLGLVIGVTSVIVLIAVGQGAQKGVTAQIRGLGTDLVFVRPGTSQDRTTGTRNQAVSLTKSDADALAKAGIPGVTGVAPQITFGGQLIAGSNNTRATVIGTTPDYAAVRSGAVADGDFITAADLDRKALTMVLGSQLAQTLFPDGDPVGQTVRVAVGDRLGFNFRVVGVMEERGGGGTGEQDAQAFVPVTTMQSRLSFGRNPTGEVNVQQINVQTKPGANQETIKAGITDVLAERHQVATPDFLVQSQNDLLGAASQVSTTLSILLGSVAGISLVVGGIGVMNIMLVSVTERTREIGIRRAVGAQSRDIVLQFVTEALALSVGGGLIGLALGVGIAIGVDGRQIAGQTMTTLIQPWSIAVAFGVAAGVGLASGSYPAFRATAIDPIVALRNE